MNPKAPRKARVLVLHGHRGPVWLVNLREDIALGLPGSRYGIWGIWGLRFVGEGVGVSELESTASGARLIEFRVEVSRIDTSGIWGCKASELGLAFCDVATRGMARACADP